MTNDSDVEGLLENIPGNPYFLYSAFYQLDSFGLQEFFKEQGLELKVERGKRVFPVSDRSLDVVLALENTSRKWGEAASGKSCGGYSDCGRQGRRDSAEKRKGRRSRRRDCLHRRSFLSRYRLYGGWLPLCEGGRTSCDEAVPLSGAAQNRGGLVHELMG